MDGAFTSMFHPKCHSTIGLPYNVHVYMNVLNVNLRREQVNQFWNLGLQYGL